ncbi:hypothetical protein ABZ541_14145 [Micromonospora sediminicola]|uniref:hypothetical protein n=1 Tax=Micromonospora sediminicola TaxID=946078 RepID=UPI00341113B2
MIAALDLASGSPAHPHPHPRPQSLAGASGILKILRRRWPAQKLYLICDNFRPHKHPEVRAGARRPLG